MSNVHVMDHPLIQHKIGTWNGRRYACDDSGCKSRSYRFVP